MKLKELLQLIEGIQKKIGTSKAFICGGAPRDKLLNKLDKISDLDLTTGDKSVDFLVKELSIELGKIYNVQTKVMNDGHSSMFVGNLKVDFSSNFNVPNIDSILAKMGIQKPTSMQKELFSRDFTCNALLMDLNLKTIIDPIHSGFDDIKKKVIRTCLSPEITLTSNKNRVVRIIYLAAKLDFNVDPAIIAWVKANPDSIRISSPSSLTEKLNKAVSYNPQKTAQLLDQMGLWDHIPITESLYAHYTKRKGTNVK
ncbi:MAG TPA: hypothetical protein VNW06_01780 [Cytophagaceae bacterium]|jgi:tRNA nucleotidyltransferase/poly(A) polymerase|nr:hypothetical protein [Cytophagaceae bacterium]